MRAEWRSNCVDQMVLFGFGTLAVCHVDLLFRKCNIFTRSLLQHNSAGFFSANPIDVEPHQPLTFCFVVLSVLPIFQNRFFSATRVGVASLKRSCQHRGPLCRHCRYRQRPGCQGEPVGYASSLPRSTLSRWPPSALKRRRSLRPEAATASVRGACPCHRCPR